MNGLTCLCLITGFVAIRRGQKLRHRALMIAAFSFSTAFLVGYVTRLSLAGTHRFPDIGIVKTLYLGILLVHSLLAAVSLPLIIIALLLAMRGRFAGHKRVVRYAWPMWVFSSGSGVVIYLMLYHLAPALQ